MWKILFHKLLYKYTMLLEFSVANFLSFKEKKTLSLEAASISDFKENIIIEDKYKILRSAVLYGANSSGKSNFIKALAIMRRIVLTSSDKSSASEITVAPFLLNTETEFEPTFFEVLFLIDGIRYRYGFEADKKLVKAEWLFIKKKKEEEYLFIRENNGIGLSPKFKEGIGVETKTRDNGLFLSKVDSDNGEISMKIINWFNGLNTISGLKHEEYTGFTFSILVKEMERNKLMNFYNQLDLGLSGIEINKQTIDSSDDIRTQLYGKELINIKTLHKKYTEKGEFKELKSFSLRDQESSGTNKLVDISGPIFDTLSKGKILLIDELDAKLHPLMTLSIIKLFNNPEYNKNNAQLIFATHDTNLLKNGKFRRDQIYFVEKDKYEASDLYSLVEYKENDNEKVRKDRSFQKDYIAGRYGAIPYIGNLKNIFNYGK